MPCACKYTHTGHKKKKILQLQGHSRAQSTGLGQIWYNLGKTRRQVVALARCTKFDWVPRTEAYLKLFLLYQMHLHFLLSARPRPYDVLTHINICVYIYTQSPLHQSATLQSAQNVFIVFHTGAKALSRAVAVAMVQPI